MKSDTLLERVRRENSAWPMLSPARFRSRRKDRCLDALVVGREADTRSQLRGFTHPVGKGAFPTSFTVAHGSDFLTVFHACFGFWGELLTQAVAIPPRIVAVVCIGSNSPRSS